MKKLLLILLAIVLCRQVNAQVNVFTDIEQPVKTIAATVFNANAPSTISGGNILLGNATSYNYDRTVARSVVAYQRIRTLSTVRYKPQGNGSLRLAVCNGNKNVFCYTHNDLNNVEALTRFELGIELPAEIQNLINIFNATGDSVAGLNPFMEWDVSVKATFTNSVAGISKQVYGYYSNDFERTSNPNPKLWGWNRLPTAHPFRIRHSFADQPGIWTAKIQVYVNNALYLEYCPFDINVAANTHGDAYVKVGANKQTMTKSGELFFPIGQNLVWPETQGEYNYSCSYNYNGQPCESSAHESFEGQIDLYAENGTNTFRLLLAPAALDIEFEKIGNYYDRLNYAWEIDNIIQRAETKGLLIDFNMLVHYGLAKGAAYLGLAWDWSADHELGFDDSYTAHQYCYAKDLNLATPDLFLSDPTAKKFYKQKIRYLISRYGYSTNIYLFELLSEINQVGDEYTIDYLLTPQKPVPSWDNAKAIRTKSCYIDSATRLGHIQKTYLWQKEMAEYIKHTLGHTEHLLTCSYADPPAAEDLSFGIPELDIISYNRYPIRYDFMGIVVQEVQQYWNTYQKPIIFSETGPIDQHGCDFGTTYRKHSWQMAFTGLAGFNIWTASYNNAQSWQELRKLKNWMVNDPEINYALMNTFKATNFYSTMFEPDHYYKEITALVGKKAGSSSHIIFGCLDNLTDNYYTNSDPLNDSSWCQNATASSNTILYPPGIPNYQVKQNFSATSQPLVPVDWPHEYHYFQWYDVNNMSPYQNTLWMYGPYSMDHPLSCITGNCLTDHPYSGRIPFKTIDSGPDNNGMMVSGAANSERESPLLATLRPNPGINRLEVFVMLPPEMAFVSLKMLDATGRLVRSADKVVSIQEFNTASLIPGIYYIQISSETGITQTLKWVKAQY